MNEPRRAISPPEDDADDAALDMQWAVRGGIPDRKPPHGRVGALYYMKAGDPRPKRAHVAIAVLIVLVFVISLGVALVGVFQGAAR